MKMNKGEFDTTSTETLICPYCGAEQEDAREQEDFLIPESWDCCDCTRDFIYTTETYIKFTSEDLGEYLSEKLSQEGYWLKVLEKELLELEKGDPNNSETLRIALERQKIKIEKCKKKILDFEKRFDDFCKQIFEPIEEEND